MSCADISKIILGVLASVGGIGGVIVVIIKISSNIIAKRLEEKYTLKLSKELEKYKSGLDNKIYISKTKFDTEFGIYRELSKAFFEMVKCINTIIPAGYSIYPADDEDRRIYEAECYDAARKSVIFAQDVLNGNVPFIPSDIFIEYNEILALCKMQLNVFEERWNVLNKSKDKDHLSSEDYGRTREINNKLTDLNTSVRDYLAKLDVLD